MSLSEFYPSSLILDDFENLHIIKYTLLEYTSMGFEQCIDRVQVRLVYSDFTRFCKVKDRYNFYYHCILVGKCISHRIVVYQSCNYTYTRLEQTNKYTVIMRDNFLTLGGRSFR